MAILKPGTLGTPSGAIGGITFAQGRGAPTIRTRGRATKRTANIATQARSDFARVAQMWQGTLSEPQRTAWNTYAQRTPTPNRFGTPRIISGFQWWMQYASTARFFNFATTVQPGQNYRYTMSSPVVVYGDASTLIVTTQGNYSVGNTLETVYISRFAAQNGAPTAYFDPPKRPFWRLCVQNFKGSDTTDYSPQFLGFRQSPLPGEWWAFWVRWSDAYTLPTKGLIVVPYPTV